jgi:uncharacterized repeat protein (TIGR02543 family)
MPFANAQQACVDISGRWGWDTNSLPICWDPDGPNGPDPSGYSSMSGGYGILFNPVEWLGWFDQVVTQNGCNVTFQSISNATNPSPVYKGTVTGDKVTLSGPELAFYNTPAPDWTFSFYSNNSVSTGNVTEVPIPFNTSHKYKRITLDITGSATGKRQTGWQFDSTTGGMVPVIEPFSYSFSTKSPCYLIPVTNIVVSNSDHEQQDSNGNIIHYPVHDKGTVGFEAVNTKDPTAFNLDWEFVDQKTGQTVGTDHESKVKFTFPQPGSYTVKLTATDSQGLPSKDSINVQIVSVEETLQNSLRDAGVYPRTWNNEPMKFNLAPHLKYSFTSEEAAQVGRYDKTEKKWITYSHFNWLQQILMNKSHLVASCGILNLIHPVSVWSPPDFYDPPIGAGVNGNPKYDNYNTDLNPGYWDDDDEIVSGLKPGGGTWNNGNGLYFEDQPNTRCGGSWLKFRTRLVGMYHKDNDTNFTWYYDDLSLVDQNLQFFWRFSQTTDDPLVGQGVHSETILRNTDPSEAGQGTSEILFVGPPPTHTLSVTNSGNGTVTTSDNSINCGTACSAEFATGSSVPLVATPNAGYQFTGWGGDCSGTGSCVVTMDFDKSVTATFVPITYNLTVTNAGNGVVQSSDSQINCGITCSATYDSGASVSLTATPITGYQFTGWNGACSGTGACSITMDAAKTLTATFTKNPIPGDLNGDGAVTCADLAIVKASFGKRTGQTGFDSRADINNDGVVDIRDLSFVSRLLLAGTKCP